MRAIWSLLLTGAPLVLAGCERQRSVPTEPSGMEFANVSSPKLKVDQSNTVSDGLGLGNGLYGQTFVPKAKNVARIDLLLQINLLQADAPVVLGIFTDITQAPIDTVTALVAAAVPGELRRTIAFEFARPVAVTKGATYTIGLHAPLDVAWEFAFGDAYPRGQVVLSDGTPLNPSADFVFTTYASK